MKQGIGVPEGRGPCSGASAVEQKNDILLTSDTNTIESNGRHSATPRLARTSFIQ